MIELMRGARIAVNTCMGVKPWEDVLVVTDPPRLKIARALVEAVRETGAETTLMCMPVGKRHGGEPPASVASAMAAADVVLAPTTFSITHTQARVKACEAGARVATMPMITEDIMGGGAMLADYFEVRDLTMKVAALLNGASEAEIETPAGTRLCMNIAGRRAHPDTGIYHKPGDFGNLPAGEAFIAPLEGTGEGQVVVDGSMVNMLRGEIKITIKEGRAVEISGTHAAELERVLREVGDMAYNLAELGIGTNPKARLMGNVLEDEKVLGTCHIALGDNSTFGGEVRAGVHLDGILLRPTLKLDGHTILKDGKFTIKTKPV